MREEFHAEVINGTKVYQRLYGWGTLTTNIWLPSLSELVGVTGTQHATVGVYCSAMQGFNTSDHYHTDKQGGAQFAYFQQFNVSGGGEKLWACGGSEQFLLRSVRWDNTTHTWMMLDATYFHTPAASSSFAVHPAVSMQVVDHSQRVLYHELQKTGRRAVRLPVW